MAAAAILDTFEWPYLRIASRTTYIARIARLSLRSCFSFESNLESNRPSDSFSNRIFESNRPYTTQAVAQPNGLQAYSMLTTSIVNVCDERGWCTDYGTLNWVICLFQFSQKTRQTMLLYAYLTPKVDFKRKFNHHQSFLCEWRLAARTIRKFRIGPSIRIKSRIGRTIRNRIESRSFAGP